MPLFSHLIQMQTKLTRLGHWKQLSYDRQFEMLSDDERAMMLEALHASPMIVLCGTISSIFVALACFFYSTDFNYLYFAIAFIATGSFRLWTMNSYNDKQQKKSLLVWKNLASRSGLSQTLGLGLFTAYTTFSQDYFCELLAVCLTLGNLIGIPSRSFISKQLITYQCAAIGVPVIFAFFYQPIGHHWILAILLIPLLISIRHISNNTRDIFLQLFRRKVEIKNLLNRFNTATSFMQHGFLIIDESGKIDAANARALLLLDIPNSSTWKGRDFQEMLDLSQKQNRLDSIAAKKLSYKIGESAGQTETRKELVETKHGAVLESTTSYRDGQLVILLEDVTERIQAENRITYMATHDNMTAVFNRVHFQHLVEQSILQQANGSSMLVVIDLDEFKHINDTYGHAAGDEILCSAAQTIKKLCGDYAITCRFGGDEFVVFAPAVEDPSEVHSFPKLLLAGLSRKHQTSYGELCIKASAGVVLEPHQNADLETMLARADLALYESKHKSPGSYTPYTAALEKNHREKQQLKDDLNEALDQGSLTVNFQPIVNLNSGRPCMFEALSRWNHTTKGEISPAVFVPLAEEMRVVGKITLLVLKKSILACSDWPSDVSVSVNLSAIDFDNPRLVTEIDSILWEANLNPARLQVEITESTFIENKKNVVKAVGELREMGVKIALDDFGTGYSNFSYLQEIALNKLKIDRCFVIDILENEKSSLLLSGISDIAKRLGMTVTVEGIETTEQLAAVQRIGTIDDVQGWVFSKAVTAAEAVEMASQKFTIPSLVTEEPATVIQFPAA